MQRPPGGVRHLHGIAYPRLTEAPEDRWIASGAVQVAINNCTPWLAGMWSQIIPAHILPGMLRWRCQITIRSNAYLLDERINAYGWNEQADGILCRLCWLRRKHRRCRRAAIVCPFSG